MKRNCLLLALVLMSFVAPALAGERAQPTDVTVGVYVVQLDDPSLKDSQFTAVFWLWFRWQGDKDLNPMKRFEVVGGQVESLDNEDTVHAAGAGGVHYQVAKVRATVTQDFDITDFPLDEHVLSLAIEETTDGVDSIRYVADTRNSKLEKNIRLAGWVLGGTTAAAGVQEYASSFGHPAFGEAETSSYARFTFSIPVSRPGVGYTIKLFWSLYLSVFVALLAFNIKPMDLDPRFGLGVGAVFAAMASAYVISSVLPDGNQVTMADTVVMISIGFIVASVIQSIVSLRLFQSGRETASARLDRWSFAAFTLAYVAINVSMLRAA